MNRCFLLLLLIPSLAFSQDIKFRKYKDGEIFRYKLTSDSYRNDKASPRAVAISQHMIIQDSGHYSEVVRWISKKLYAGNDVIDQDSIARMVTPYVISLSPGNHVKMPPLTIPEMTGEITDLNTFYVAISPALHIQKLSDKLPFFMDSVVRGNFADGGRILKGEDCIHVSQKLISHDKSIVIIETAFKPPVELSIKPLLDTIGKKTFGYFNNFQMVQQGVPGKVNLMWGVEEFTITSTIDIVTGQILKADMINLLSLRMRVNSSPDLQSYDAEIPMNIKRVLHLELMK